MNEELHYGPDKTQFNQSLANELWGEGKGAVVFVIRIPIRDLEACKTHFINSFRVQRGEVQILNTKVVFPSHNSDRCSFVNEPRRCADVRNAEIIRVD